MLSRMCSGASSQGSSWAWEARWAAVRGRRRWDGAALATAAIAAARAAPPAPSRASAPAEAAAWRRVTGIGASALVIGGPFRWGGLGWAGAAAL